MKNKLTLLSILCAALFLSACSTAGTSQSPPSAFDAKIWSIQTNYFNVTNTVIQTNIQTQVQTVTVTNQVAGVANVTSTTNTVTVTNFIPLVQVVPGTNYTYGQGETAAAVETASATFGGPWGAVAGGALSLVLGVWGSFKSRQATTSSNIANNGQQAIAVARNVIAAMPNGATLTAQFNAFLAKHQADANIATEIAAIVDQEIDPNAAHGAAQLILNNLVTPIPTAASLTAKS